MVLLKKHGHEIRRHAFKQTAAVFREQSRDTYLVILQEKENMRQRTGQIKAHFSRQPCPIVYATTSHETPRLQMQKVLAYRSLLVERIPGKLRVCWSTERALSPDTYGEVKTVSYFHRSKEASAKCLMERAQNNHAGRSTRTIHRTAPHSRDAE